MEIKIGQIWESNEDRDRFGLVRTLEVIGIDDEIVLMISKCRGMERRIKISKKRMRDVGGGYRLVKDFLTPNVTKEKLCVKKLRKS